MGMREMQERRLIQWGNEAMRQWGNDEWGNDEWGNGAMGQWGNAGMTESVGRLKNLPHVVASGLALFLSGASHPRHFRRKSVPPGPASDLPYQCAWTIGTLGLMPLKHEPADSRSVCWRSSTTLRCRQCCVVWPSNCPTRPRACRRTIAPCAGRVQRRSSPQSFKWSTRRLMRPCTGWNFCRPPARSPLLASPLRSARRESCAPSSRRRAGH